MVILSFKNKKDKEHLLSKAKKMEEYASMIVDCIEECNQYDDEDYYERRMYKGDPEEMESRYSYRRMR
jgi:hypothetical protein